MTTQVKTTMGKVETAMRCAAFVRGFKDARKGKPLIYEAYARTNDQWNYERGRQFAFIFTGALKNGARLTWQAKAAMQDALYCQAIR